MRFLLAAIAVLLAAQAYAEVDIFAALERYADSRPPRVVVAPHKPQPVARPLTYPSHSVSGRTWRQDGHAVTASHLTGTHGFDAAFVAKLTQAQRDALHADAHEGRVRSSAVYRSDCPDGRCPTVSRSVTTTRTYTRGIFRRR